MKMGRRENGKREERKGKRWENKVNEYIDGNDKGENGDDKDRENRKWERGRREGEMRGG